MIINLAINVMCIQDVYMALVNPIEFMTQSNTCIIPLAAITAINIYHFIYFHYNFIDYIHNIFIILIVIPGCFYNKFYGITNAILFFAMGLTQTIHNFMMILTTIEKLKPITEKRITMILNTWIRVPGILYTCTLAYIQGYLDNDITFTRLLLITYFITCTLYQGYTKTLNYGKRLGKKR